MANQTAEEKIAEIHAYVSEMSTIYPHTQYEEGLKNVSTRILHIINRKEKL